MKLTKKLLEQTRDGLHALGNTEGLLTRTEKDAVAGALGLLTALLKYPISELQGYQQTIQYSRFQQQGPKKLSVEILADMARGDRVED